MKFLLFAALVCFVVGSPSQQRLRALVAEKEVETDLIKRALSIAPKDSQLLTYRSQNDGAITAEELIASLPANSTIIRENIVGGFSCVDRIYGYYADVSNDCQIFHICFNLWQVFPDTYKKGTFFMFSFICPESTVFTQDSMVCAWERSAVPCQESEKLYFLNERFFKEDENDIKKLPSAKKPTKIKPTAIENP